MASIKTLAIAGLPVLALLAFPQAASARGSGFVSVSNTVHGNNGVNTNLFALPPPPPPATALPKRRNSPRPM